MNSTISREMAVCETIKHSLASARSTAHDDLRGADRHIVCADRLVDVLFEMCAEYHSALGLIQRLVINKASLNEIHEVLDNLHNPL